VRLGHVGTVTDVEHKGFEARKTHAQLTHDVVGGKEDAAAVDAAGEAYANGLMRRHALQPLRELVGNRAHVCGPYLVQVGGQHSLGRREKTCIDRVGIGAPDQLERNHVMAGTILV